MVKLTVSLQPLFVVGSTCFCTADANDSVPTTILSNDDGHTRLMAGPCQASPRCHSMTSECTATTSSPVLAGLDLVEAYTQTAALDNTSIPVYGTSEFAATPGDCK